MEDISNLNELLIHKVDLLLRSEKFKLEHLHEFQDKATSTSLIDHITDDIVKTEEHSKKLENILQQLGGSPTNAPSRVAEGWLADHDHIIGQIEDKEVIDKVIGTALDQVNNMNIVLYDSISRSAEIFEHYEVSALSHECKEELEQFGKDLEKVKGNIPEEIT